MGHGRGDVGRSVGGAARRFPRRPPGEGCQQLGAGGSGRLDGRPCSSHRGSRPVDRHRRHGRGGHGADRQHLHDGRAGDRLDRQDGREARQPRLFVQVRDRGRARAARGGPAGPRGGPGAGDDRGGRDHLPLRAGVPPVHEIRGGGAQGGARHTHRDEHPRADHQSGTPPRSERCRRRRREGGTDRRRCLR